MYPRRIRFVVLEPSVVLRGAAALLPTRRARAGDRSWYAAANWCDRRLARSVELRVVPGENDPSAPKNPRPSYRVAHPGWPALSADLEQETHA